MMKKHKLHRNSGNGGADTAKDVWRKAKNRIGWFG